MPTQDIISPLGTLAGDFHARSAETERFRAELERIRLGGDPKREAVTGPQRGLVSDFGADLWPDGGSRVVETWDPERERRDRAAEAMRNAAGRRRAHIANAPVVERINRAEIIARDKSTCYLCGKVAIPSEIHLDHVVPLSAGGEHSAANVRVTHASCNLSKGARVIPVAA